MAIIKTIEGEYYELADEFLQKCLVPKDVVAKHSDRVKASLRINISEEFKTVDDNRNEPGKDPGIAPYSSI